MRKHSTGKQWEELNKERQKAEEQEMEAQKAAAYQAMRAQIEGLPSLRSLSATFAVDGPQYFQDSKSRFHRRQEDMLELEAQGSPPPPYQQQDPLTPPASEGEYLEAGSDDQIEHSQKVEHKERKITSLESEIEVEKDKRRRLQAERHEAVDAQRRAEKEIRQLKRKVTNLDQLLDGSIKREKELEVELDVCREEIRELKRRSHELRCSYENDTRAQETRERQIKQQVEDANAELLKEIGRDRHTDQDAGLLLEGEVQGKRSPQCEIASHNRQTDQL